ncbi:uncharacterized protein LOC134697507 [Mytilus trossulus]|uniref:uncharacterized protein LOC134697507 n=1 Tax=Mytilus trossulus TaxID=6551 RepID=UPI003006E2C2
MYNILTSHKPKEFNLERFWELESLGIDSNTTDVETVDYMETYQKSAIEFRENKYIAKLPWKPDHEPLPTNFVVTKRRTENVIRKLSQDPKMLKVYGQIFNDQERRGFIEKVKDPDISKGIVHYIPHHPVKKDSTTAPIRIVYDCSCRQASQLPSLNDCLMNTPPILNDLTKILIRFRLSPVAIVTDIEKAFLHVGLHEQDRDVTRFLWLDNPVDQQSDLATFRFKSVLFGATCSPFILNAVLLKHLQQTENETTKILTRDLYVDNILSSICNKTQAVTYFKEARQLMLNAGFNLRSWTSNNENVRNLAIKEDVLDTDKEAKILGMRWNVETDELSYAKRVLPFVSSNITKREILKESSKIFDPLGFLSPVSIRAKILMQDLWKECYDWDEPLPENLQLQWMDLAKDIGIVTSMKLPRQYFTGNTNSRSLHVFVDASMKAYGAVAYMYLSKGHSAALVMAKTRVAPVKTLTLPQLELMAAVIGACLTQHLKSTLECTDVTLWSDSQIVLQLLKTSKPLKRFVSNRIKEINELTEECKWKYCPTNCNPADLLTRGITAKQFMGNVLWKTGPTCLIQNSANLETHLPINTALSVLADDNEETLDEESNTDKNDNLHFGIDKIINANRYGSYKKLLRVTTYIQRFIQNCKTTKSIRNTGEIQPDELQQSTILWIRCYQATAYPGEVRALT